jgi:hypothetical protein
MHKPSNEPLHGHPDENTKDLLNESPQLFKNGLQHSSSSSVLFQGFMK